MFSKRPLLLNLFLASAVSAYSADIEWSGGAEFQEGSNWRAHWQDGGNWVGGTAPTAEDTAVLGADAFKDRNYGYVNAPNSTILAKDIVVYAHDTFGININRDVSISGNLYVTANGSGSTFRLNSLNKDYTFKADSMYVGRGRADAGGSYQLSANSTYLKVGYFDQYVVPFSSVELSGNLLIDGKYSGITCSASFGSASVSIAGIVDMVSSSGATKILETCAIPNKTDVESRVCDFSAGGFSGSGTIRSGNWAANGAAATTNIAITGSGANAFSGSVQNDSVSAFNLSHTGSGSQTINLESGHFDSVSVSKGILKIGSAESNGALSVSGGLFGASSAAEFASVEISGGGLAYSAETFLGGLADTITVSGKFSKTSDEKIAMDFGGLDAESLIGLTYDLLSAEFYEGISQENDADEYFSAQNLHNALANFKWDGNKLTVAFAAVPEPSEAAAIFAAAVLAAALARHKMR